MKSPTQFIEYFQGLLQEKNVNKINTEYHAFVNHEKEVNDRYLRLQCILIITDPELPQAEKMLNHILSMLSDIKPMMEKSDIYKQYFYHRLVQTQYYLEYVKIGNAKIMKPTETDNYISTLLNTYKKQFSKEFGDPLDESKVFHKLLDSYTDNRIRSLIMEFSRFVLSGYHTNKTNLRWKVMDAITKVRGRYYTMEMAAIMIRDPMFRMKMFGDTPENIHKLVMTKLQDMEHEISNVRTIRRYFDNLNALRIANHMRTFIPLEQKLKADKLHQFIESHGMPSPPPDQLMINDIISRLNKMTLIQPHQIQSSINQERKKERESIYMKSYVDSFFLDYVDEKEELVDQKEWKDMDTLKHDILLPLISKKYIKPNMSLAKLLQVTVFGNDNLNIVKYEGIMMNIINYDGNISDVISELKTIFNEALLFLIKISSISISNQNRLLWIMDNMLFYEKEWKTKKVKKTFQTFTLSNLDKNPIKNKMPSLEDTENLEYFGKLSISSNNEDMDVDMGNDEEDMEENEDMENEDMDIIMNFNPIEEEEEEYLYNQLKFDDEGGLIPPSTYHEHSGYKAIKPQLEYVNHTIMNELGTKDEECKKREKEKAIIHSGMGTITLSIDKKDFIIDQQMYSYQLMILLPYFKFASSSQVLFDILTELERPIRIKQYITVDGMNKDDVMMKTGVFPYDWINTDEGKGELNYRLMNYKLSSIDPIMNDMLSNDKLMIRELVTLTKHIKGLDELHQINKEYNDLYDLFNHKLDPLKVMTKSEVIRYNIYLFMNTFHKITKSSSHNTIRYMFYAHDIISLIALRINVKSQSLLTTIKNKVLLDDKQYEKEHKKDENIMEMDDSVVLELALEEEERQKNLIYDRDASLNDFFMEEETQDFPNKPHTEYDEFEAMDNYETYGNDYFT